MSKFLLVDSICPPIVWVSIDIDESSGLVRSLFGCFVLCTSPFVERLYAEYDDCCAAATALAKESTNSGKCLFVTFEETSAVDASIRHAPSAATSRTPMATRAHPLAGIMRWFVFSSGKAWAKTQAQARTWYAAAGMTGLTDDKYQVVVEGVPYNIPKYALDL